MHYLIFIPNKAAANKQNLIDAGLGDLLREGDVSPMCADLVGRGPGDLPGQIWTWGNAIPAYLPDQQTWTAAKQGGYWVGVNNGQPPTPEDLQRKQIVDGLVQEMADGNQWILPNVLTLPAVYAEDDQGEVIRVPHKRYQKFVDEASWALQSCFDVIEMRSKPDWRRGLDFVVQALCINYRVNRSIVLQLGIIDDARLYTCMAKATDAAAIRELLEELKKKASVSNPGG